MTTQSELEKAAEEWVDGRYYDRKSVGEEIIQMDIKCGKKDFQAGAECLLSKAREKAVTMRVTNNYNDENSNIQMVSISDLEQLCGKGKA